MQLLYLSSVWPEPESSAAGTRVKEIISACLEADWQICFAATAEKTPYSAPLEEMGLRCEAIQVNDASFDEFVSAVKPDIVIFDRFMVEEQFSQRIAQVAPEAVRVLDTSDLHFLRKARQRAFYKNENVDLYSDDALREIAALYRCDLSCVISRVEERLLLDQFRFAPELVHYLPFMLSASERLENSPAFAQRQHFMHIGNFLHKPNADAVEYLREDIWPKIRTKLPEAECHIYGAYANEQQKNLSIAKMGFFIKGRCEHARNTMARYRVNLAPLRFGAGQKGKIIDAWLSGTPNAVSEIAAEAMFFDDAHFLPARSDDDFVETAVEYYQNETLWIEEQKRGYEVLKKYFSAVEHAKKFIQRLQDIYERIESHRHHNVMGRILQREETRSTYYMSKWIEEKNK